MAATERERVLKRGARKATSSTDSRSSSLLERTRAVFLSALSGGPASTCGEIRGTEDSFTGTGIFSSRLDSVKRIDHHLEKH